MTPGDSNPPRLATALLSLCLPPGVRGEVILGDLHEGYLARAVPRRGDLPRDLWYWSHLFRTGAPFLARRVIRRRLYRKLDRENVEAVVTSPMGSMMRDLLNDIRFAFRSFRRSPGLAVGATLILGIGVGSITLMFSILNTAVLQPLPFEDPDELVWLWGESETVSRNSVSYLDLADFRAGTDVFEALGGFSVFSQTQFLTGRDEAEQVTARIVTADLFSVLGATPELGRSFLPQEEEGRGDPVAILSHSLWMRRFAGDPGVVGSVISLEDQPVEVVGVMPSWFDFPAGADLWVPAQRTQSYAQNRGNNNFSVVGRLKEGVSLDQAQAQLDVVSANIAAAAPDLKAGWGARLVSLHERFFGDAREMLLILVGIVSLVPVVASANVASLFLARAASRVTEMASRLALGASRSRLVRQLLTESLVVALGGGLMGLVLAFGGGRAFRAFAPMAVPRLENIGVDGAVLAFTLLASFLMVPLFGVLPALRGTDLGISETLKVGGGRGMSQRRTTFRDGLVVAQVALSLMLLMASGLLLRSYRNLQGQELGFQSESLLYARVALPRFKYETSAQVRRSWDELDRLMRSSPRLLAMGAVDRPPLSGAGPTNDVWAAERPPSSAVDRRDATRRFVTEDYFDVMRVPVLSGRTFGITDGQNEDEDPPVIVNEALARQHFPGEDPLGKTLVFDYDIIRNLEVVGVVADVKEGDPGMDAPPTFYLPARWRPRLNMNVFVRSRGDPLELAEVFRRSATTVDPDIPVPTVRTMESRLSDALFQPRFRSVLVALFAAVALILSAIGLYGVLACFVRDRTHEMGIRLALGAGTTGTAGLVVRRGLILVGFGILLGLVGALAGARVMQSWLYGVSAMDPVTCLGVSLFLAVVALSACMVPTLRALRVDPVEVLKAQ